MAFDKTKMHRLNVGPHPRYSYQTADAIATVVASGYFNDMADELEVDEVIEVVSSTGGTSAVDLLVVQTNDGTTVTTTNGT